MQSPSDYSMTAVKLFVLVFFVNAQTMEKVMYYDTPSPSLCKVAKI